MAKLNFVGDVAIFKRFEEERIDPLSKVDLPLADFNVANLEFPLPGDSDAGNFYDIDQNYRVSDHFSSLLQLARFDLYSLANNHVQDYGSDGIRRTIEKLKDSGVGHFGVGLSGFNVVEYTIQNLFFLFLGVVKRGRWDRKDSKTGPDPYDSEALVEFISEVKGCYDHIVVFPHWGTELVDAPDPVDVINARLMIDAGASCVIGHHPHVTQGVEEYKRGLIAYSLGSFIYLPSLEKGNFDKSSSRNISICLSVEFGKNSLVNYIPYKYILDEELLIPINHGNYCDDDEFSRLCSVIGNRSYYSHKVRKILFKREIISFLSRFIKNPGSTILFYSSYVKFKHVKKLLGLS